MTSLAMPKPDRNTLSNRAEIVAQLREIVPGEGVVDTANGMRVFESDGLTAYRQMPMVVVLPETQPREHPRRAARLGHIAVRRRSAA
jgi:hypothetical protein